jgi:hypothetical protein
MRIGKSMAILLVASGALSTFVMPSEAQAPPAARPAAPAARPAAPAASAMQVHANLIQLMRGTLYPASNVIFAAQNDNPADIKEAKDPSVAPNPLESTYGKWQAVENAALAITEVANLLTLPRKCANGKDAPVKNADWLQWVQGLRDAGMTTYKAATAKDQDKIVDAADVITTACANCHNKYREKPTLAQRCQ